MLFYVREALAALSGRRLQLFLATFGVGIGVASMVLLVSLVAGVHRMVLREMRMSGVGLVEISITPPRRTIEQPPVRLTSADARAFAHASPLLGRSSPRRSIQVQNARWGPNETQINLQAVGDTYIDMLRLPLMRGRSLDAEDLANRRRVAVIGAGIARMLFGEDEALGQTILLGDWPFEVVGILDWVIPPDEPDRVSFRDRETLVPYTTAHETFVYPEQADTVLVEISHYEAHAEAAAAVKANLVHRYSLSSTQTEWVRVMDSVERTREMEMIMFALKTLVGLVGGISLFVGAVGVMNIMIVSVTQRTSEIGLRRAVGARSSWIRRQFLVEAIMITGAGGVIGLLFASTVVALVPYLPIDEEFPDPVVTPMTVFVALSVILLTGVAAGFVPAARASRITPVEALRHE